MLKIQKNHRTGMNYFINGEITKHTFQKIAHEITAKERGHQSRICKKEAHFQ